MLIGIIYTFLASINYSFYMSNLLVKLINEATDDFLVDCDWEKSFEVCSHVKSKQDGNTFVITLRKNLERGSERTKARSVDLLQIAMQNSYFVLWSAHQPDFQRFLVDLINGKSLPIESKDKLLNLVRAWGEAFRPESNHSGFPNYFKTYQFIVKNHSFPPRGDDSNYMPPAAPSASRASHRPLQPPSHSSSLLDKVVYALEEKTSQQKLLKEILQAVDPSVENIRDNDIVKEVLAYCLEYQQEIHNVIERVSDESTLMALLQFNDTMEEILNDIQKLETAFLNRDSNPKPQTQSSSFGALDSPVVLDLGMSVPSFEKPFLDDRNSTEVQPPSQSSPTTNQTDDFDDLFDQLANRHAPNAQKQVATQPSLDIFASSISEPDTVPSLSPSVEDIFSSPSPSTQSNTPDIFKDFMS